MRLMSGCLLSHSRLRWCLSAEARSWSTANASVTEMPTRPWRARSASSSICGPYRWPWAAWMTVLVSRVSRSMAVSMPGVGPGGAIVAAVRRSWGLVMAAARSCWTSTSSRERRAEPNHWRGCQLLGRVCRSPDTSPLPVESIWPSGRWIGGGASEVRASEVRAAEIRPNEARPDKLCAAEVHAAKLRVAQLGTAQDGAAEVRVAEIDVAEARGTEDRTAEVRGAEVRGEEVRLTKVRIAQDGAVEVHAAEVREVEVRAAKVRTAKVCSAEVKRYEIQRRIIRCTLATPQDGKRGLDVGGADAQFADEAIGATRRRLDWCRGAATQVGDQHLGHGETISGRLLGDLFQPIDAAKLDLLPVAAQLVDRMGKLELTQFPGHPESWRQGRPREVRDGTHLPSRVPP